MNVEVIREGDFGKTNDIVDVETHLGSTVRINGNVLGEIKKNSKFNTCIRIRS